MFENVGTGELLIILLVILIFFGSKKIPDIAQGLGKGIREFRKATRDIQETVQSELTKVDQTPQRPPPSIKCAQCNAENPAGSKFCNSCGTKLPV